MNYFRPILPSRRRLLITLGQGGLGGTTAGVTGIGSGGFSGGETILVNGSLDLIDYCFAYGGQGGGGGAAPPNATQYLTGGAVGGITGNGFYFQGANGNPSAAPGESSLGSGGGKGGNSPGINGQMALGGAGGKNGSGGGPGSGVNGGDGDAGDNLGTGGGGGGGGGNVGGNGGNGGVGFVNFVLFP
jgi:hypothetical protein